jgi:quercetin dioxygenase-like cupin family protein
MAARWSKGAVSAIHGHPMFAFYYLLEGELSVENFEKDGAGVRKTGTRRYNPGQYFCMHGNAGVFDNGIHRVTAVQESLSIHIYSDDAMKGEIFQI